jgi:protoheme IX farnesyltransferase
MILYASALIPVSLLPTPLGLTGTVYLIGALMLGAMMLGFAAVARGQMSRRAVRRVFLGSLAYQPLLLALMLLDTVRS